MSFLALVFRAQTALSCQEEMYVTKKMSPFTVSLGHKCSSVWKAQWLQVYNFIFSALFHLHIHHQPVLRAPSAAPQKKHTPALSSPLIKAAENVPSSCRRQPGLVKCSAPECHSSWTPGSRLISSTFYSRGHTGEGTRTDCHNSSQCCLCSGSPLHVIQGIYTHTREHVWQWLCSCL